MCWYREPVACWSTIPLRRDAPAEKTTEAASISLVFDDFVMVIALWRVLHSSDIFSFTNNWLDNVKGDREWAHLRTGRKVLETRPTRPGKTKHMKITRIATVIVLTGLADTGFATSYEDCLIEQILQADESVTVAELDKICKANNPGQEPVLDVKVRECVLHGALAQEDVDSLAPEERQTAQGLLENCQRLANEAPEVPDRLVQEKLVEDNPYVLSAHKRNYILPATYMDDPNQAPYSGGEAYPGLEDPMENTEVKLQVSLKVPLSYSDLLMANDALYFGFTLKSFWQLYNKEISAPFRETNYNPEIYYEVPVATEVLNGTLLTRFGIEHESNGRTQLLSRSWNRAYVLFGYGQSNWGVALRPWYRLPEDAKEDDGDPLTPPPSKGDDNPDIEDYMGHFELIGAYKTDGLQYSGMLRQNFGTGKGAVELGMSFPLWGRMHGYVELFSGYGESLIDYNHKVNRIGLGILLTDWL
jgi:phospholipase A1